MTLAELFRAGAELYEPDDAIGLTGLIVINAAAIISAIGVLVLGVITVRGQRRGRARAKRTDAMTDEIHEQTVNDHQKKSNLRTDVDQIRDQGDRTREAVDEIRELVKDMVDRQIAHGRDIRGTRTDVGELRAADRDAEKAQRDAAKVQREFEQRVQAAFRREHPGSPPL